MATEFTSTPMGKDMKGIGEKVSRKAAECCIHPMEESNSEAIG